MKKTNFLLIVFLLFNTISICQIVDIDYHPNLTPLMSVEDSLRQAAEQNKPQFLKNGFVDFVSDGSIQASARLLRINIGEMNKFYLPLFIYTGASGKTFGHDKLNQTTVSNLLNPIGGTLNVSFNGLQNLIRSRKGQITKLKFGYQFGGRLVNGNDSIIKDNINFFNGFFNFGFFFQTGAWVSEDPSNMGVFYLQANFTSSFSSKSDIQKIFGNTEVDKSYFLGYFLDAGVEIDKVINLKLGLYQYLNNSKIALLKDPVVKFSLDYTMKK